MWVMQLRSGIPAERPTAVSSTRSVTPEEVLDRLETVILIQGYNFL